LVVRVEGIMETKELLRLRELLRSALEEVQAAAQNRAEPDWAQMKEKLLKAVELVRRIEREQMWSALLKRK
jgi:hypothetical protein